jgi:AcrR family transcriptional regulator
MNQSRTRSTSSVRRAEVLDAAHAVFARTGYHATPVSDVAHAAGISQGYVVRLFGTKLQLFVAVLDRCYRRITEQLEAAADGAGNGSAVLDAMADAYAALIADRDLLMLQVHAQSAADVPAVRASTRRGLERIVETATRRSGASDDDVQRFLAYGQLCHLVVTADLDSVPEKWARVVTHNLTHPGTQPEQLDSQPR